MPKEGYENLTIKEELKEKIKKLAEEKGLSIEKFLEEAIEFYKKGSTCASRPRFIVLENGELQTTHRFSELASLVSHLSRYLKRAKYVVVIL
ncbi:MAG TPA: ribbon-helix-helix protein, CopG family [Candidatus Korarchaeota archaeon]|nr:ribbon-helix-helix protein, CopG family [Candidatus Korarchaeota archaeon]